MLRLARLSTMRDSLIQAGYLAFCFGVFLGCIVPAATIGIYRSLTKKADKPRGVFLGVHGMLGLVSRMREILESKDIPVMSFTVYPGRFFDQKSWSGQSVLSRKFAAAALLPKVLFKTDMVWFISHYSLLPMRADYALFWLSRCVLVVQHTGSDVRFEPLQNSLYRTVGLRKRYPENRFTWRDFGKKVSRQISAELFGNVACLRSAATLQYKPMFRGFFPVDGLEGPKKPSPNPLVVHAPSNRSRKNTAEVIEAIERVRQSELCFDFICLEDTSNDVVLGYLNRADLVIDARDTWVGVFGVESLARSCAVIGGADSEFESMPSTPVIPFPDSTEQLVGTLMELLQNVEERGRIMEKSWNFWADHYSREAFGAYFMRIWNSTEEKIVPHPLREFQLRRASASLNPMKRYQVFIRPLNEDSPVPPAVH